MDSEKPQLQLVRAIAESLCEQPDEIELSDSIDERGVLIRLYVAKADLPRMIGKGGETANAIRLLLRAIRCQARSSILVQGRRQVAVQLVVHRSVS
jgi:predicted RNA-binding protein YlqC (UPF0109 family)